MVNTVYDEIPSRFFEIVDLIFHYINCSNLFDESLPNIGWSLKLVATGYSSGKANSLSRIRWTLKDGEIRRGSIKTYTIFQMFYWLGSALYPQWQEVGQMRGGGGRSAYSSVPYQFHNEETRILAEIVAKGSRHSLRMHSFISTNSTRINSPYGCRIKKLHFIKCHSTRG